MTSAFRLACIQVNAGNDLTANVEAASLLTRAAGAEGADLIAFSECVAMMEQGRERSLAASAPANATRRSLPFVRWLWRQGPGCWRARCRYGLRTSGAPTGAI